MKEMSLFENIGNSISTLTSSSSFVFVLIAVLVLMPAMIILFKQKHSSYVFLSLGVLLISVLIIPLTNSQFFIETIDQFFTELVRAIYFPTYYVYIFMMFLVYINTINILRKNSKIRPFAFSLIQIIGFFIFQILLFNIVTIVLKNDIDVFDTTSVYSNTELMSSLQVSSYIVWAGVILKILTKILYLILGRGEPAKNFESKFYSTKPVNQYYSNTSKKEKKSLFDTNNKEDKKTEIEQPQIQEFKPTINNFDDMPSEEDNKKMDDILFGSGFGSSTNKIKELPKNEPKQSSILDSNPIQNNNSNTNNQDMNNIFSAFDSISSNNKQNDDENTNEDFDDFYDK